MARKPNPPLAGAILLVSMFHAVDEMASYESAQYSSCACFDHIPTIQLCSGQKLPSHALEPHPRPNSIATSSTVSMSRPNPP
jgi:hypothetical protein